MQIRISDAIAELDDDGNLKGIIFITDQPGHKQVHAINNSVGKIRAIKIAKEFLKDKHGIYTGLKNLENNMQRILFMLGFKLMGQIKGIFLFIKD